MFLLGSENTRELEWVFSVEGSTGSAYSVLINDQKATCTCFDFKRRKVACKHIMFISTRVLKRADVSVLMTSEISALLSAVVEAAGDQVAPQGPGGQDSCGTCVICYEDYNYTAAEAAVALDFCLVCRNGFHGGCLRVWFKRQKNCPLCRTRWAPAESAADLDPMAKFTRTPQ